MWPETFAKTALQVRHSRRLIVLAGPKLGRAKANSLQSPWRRFALALWSEVNSSEHMFARWCRVDGTPSPKLLACHLPGANASQRQARPVAESTKFRGFLPNAEQLAHAVAIGADYAILGQCVGYV